jgi:hypothetical protein
MLGLLHYRLAAGNGRPRVDQVGWRIGATAGFTAIAVLVFRPALGTGAANEPVRQEHAFLFVEKLQDITALNMAVAVQVLVNALDEFAVVFAVSRGIIVKADAEIPEIGFVLLVHHIDEFFRRFAFGARPQHDRRSVSVVGPGEIALVTPRALETGPDVRLDVFQHVAQMNRAVGVRQRAGHEDLSLVFCHVLCRSAAGFTGYTAQPFWMNRKLSHDQGSRSREKKYTMCRFTPELNTQGPKA